MQQFWILFSFRLFDDTTFGLDSLMLCFESGKREILGTIRLEVWEKVPCPRRNIRQMSWLCLFIFS